MIVCISDENSAYSHSPGSIYNHPEDVPLKLSLYTGQRFILTKQTHSYTKHFLYTKKKKKREKRKSSLSYQIHQFNFPLSKYLCNLQERFTGLNPCIICKL